MKSYFSDSQRLRISLYRTVSVNLLWWWRKSKATKLRKKISFWNDYLVCFQVFRYLVSNLYSREISHSRRNYLLSYTRKYAEKRNMFDGISHPRKNLLIGHAWAMRQRCVWTCHRCRHKLCGTTVALSFSLIKT